MGSGDVYRYPSTDPTSFIEFTCQYPAVDLQFQKLALGWELLLIHRVVPMFCVRVLLTIAVAGLLPACSGDKSNVTRGNRDGVFHYGNGTEPQSLDPHVLTGIPETNIAGALFEGLVTINPYTLEAEPGVAESWTFNDDQKIITFRLNPRARWSNGDPVTARDFVWSFHRSLDPAMGNLNAEQLFPIKNAEAFASGIISDRKKLGARALGPHVFELTLEQPTPYILALLATYVAYPVHQRTVEKFGLASDRFTRWTRVENIVSNGPFTLKEWKLNRRVTVEKSQTYWNAHNVKLNGIVFHPIESSVTEERMFRAGQLHYTQGVPLGKVPVYKAMENSPYVNAPYLGTYYYMFNTLQAPMDDVKVRRALAMSIDRETLVDTMLQNVFLPSYSLTPTGIPGYQVPRVFNYDPGRARALLAQAGYPNGRNWPGLEVTYNTSKNHQKIAIAIQQMWKKELNINVTIVNLEWKVYLDLLSQMNFQMARAAWIGSYLDPRAFLGIFIKDGGNNGTGFASPRFDDLVFKQAPATRTREARLAVMQKAESILLEQMPIIPLFSYTSNHLIHTSVKGLPPNLLDAVNLRYVWLE